MDEGPFATPKLPSSLPVSRRTIEADNGLCQAQQSWTTMGIEVCKGILMVGEATQELLQLAHSPHPIPHEALAYIRQRLSHDAAKPFGHALHMAASKVNDLCMDYLKEVVPPEGEELLEYFNRTYVSGTFQARTHT